MCACFLILPISSQAASIEFVLENKKARAREAHTAMHKHKPASLSVIPQRKAPLRAAAARGGPKEKAEAAKTKQVSK